MSPDPMESLFAQLSHFLVEEGLSVYEWKVAAAEFGVGSIAENVHRFYRSWNWEDPDRQSKTITFFRRVHDEDEKLAFNLARRVYSLTNGADEEQLRKYPALELLQREIEEGVAVGVPQVPVHSEKFLSIPNVPGTFYPDLVEDINQCYRLGIYDATLVLSRKLLENLLIDILRKQYGTDQIRLYYNPDNAWFVRFSTLIDNFANNLQDFKHLSGALNDEFIDELNAFRQSANEGAHSIETNMTQDEIGQYRDQARHAAQVLFRVYEHL